MRSEKIDVFIADTEVEDWAFDASDASLRKTQALVRGADEGAPFVFVPSISNVDEVQFIGLTESFVESSKYNVRRQINITSSDLGTSLVVLSVLHSLAALTGSISDSIVLSIITVVGGISFILMDRAHAGSSTRDASALGERNWMAGRSDLL